MCRTTQTPLSLLALSWVRRAQGMQTPRLHGRAPARAVVGPIGLARNGFFPYKGLKIESRRFSGSAEVIEAKWRGPDENFIVEGLDGEKSCEVQVGFLGDD
jgi:hypothetical protein